MIRSILGGIGGIVPHPMWFNVISLAAIVAGTWYAKTVASSAPDNKV